MRDGRDDDGFLSRWSQRKQRVRAGETPVDAPLDAPLVTPVAAGHGLAAPSTPLQPLPMPMPTPERAGAHDRDTSDPAPQAAKPPLPTLDDVAGLTPDADFSRFVATDVDGSVRNAALHKLFSDPHFNVMDGLDTYIDDYNTPDPLPASMLRRMVQSRALGLFDDEASAPPSTDAADTPAALPPHDQAPDEDADLRLQPLDAAGREGAEPGAGEDGPGEH